MKSRRQALRLCLDTTVVVVVQIYNEFLFEVFQRVKFLQIEQFTFKQTEEIFDYSIVKTVSVSAHTLPDAFLLEHLLILPVLILPALVRMKNEIGSIRNLLKSFVQHGSYHAQYRSG